MTGGARRLIWGRTLRGLGDGVVSVLLTSHLLALGFTGAQVGWLATATLWGSGLCTLALGAYAHRFSRRTLLLAAAVLMALTGLGFGLAQHFWVLMAIAAIGTLNPSSGDVSVFTPLESAALADEGSSVERPHLYASWNFAGAMATALGALLCSAPFLPKGSYVWAFFLYAGLGLAVGLVYLRIPRGTGEHLTASAPLKKSRGVVVKLALLFSLDSAAGGLVLDALLALWLFRRFGFRVEEVGALFFVSRLLAAASQFLSARLAARIGLVRTMVFTHLPANAFIAAAAFMPTATGAVVMILLRNLLSKMDVPARQALVMELVTPEERAAAASFTNVPRSLASAATPVLAGALLDASSFGWPLVICGAAKAIYDLWLLYLFDGHRTASRAQSRE